ncbi:hypothetical protein HK096_003470, partial [Nowakowskiella sp. JEL0078]
MISDIVDQFYRDQESGFRLTLEVAGISSFIEILSLLIANIPSTLIVSVVIIIFQFAAGVLSTVSPFSVFLIILVGLLANASFGLLLSLRIKALPAILVPVLMILSAIGFKDDYLYATTLTSAGQAINFVFTPGTLATIVGRIIECDYLGQSVFANDRINFGFLLLIIQFAAYTILCFICHIVLPGKMTPLNLFKFGSDKSGPKDEIKESDSPILQLRLLDNTYKTKKGVRNVNFDIRGGQSVALLGHNGAGKSSLISILCGVRNVRNGFFRYVVPNKAPLIMSKNSNDIKEFRQIVGFCPQHNALRDELSAYDHLEFIAAIRGIKSVTHRTETEDGNVVEEKISLREYLEGILNHLELTEAMNRPIKTYSGGMLRKTCLAVSLVGEPSILILDEFTTGMDIISRSQLWVMLKSLTKSEDKNRILLFSTHDMQEAEVLSDYVAIIARGESKVFSTPNELISKNSNYFHLIIEKSVSEPVFNGNAVEDYLSEYFERSEISIFKETTKSITYVVPKFASKLKETLKSSKFLHSLMKNQTKLGILDVNLDAESLEKVFLDITNKAYEEEEFVEKILTERGKKAIGMWEKFLNEKAERAGWNNASEKEIQRKVNLMKMWTALIFSLKSAFISNGGVYFGSATFALALVIWANLFSNGNSASLASLDFYPFQLSYSRGENLILMDSRPINLVNLTETSFYGKFNENLGDLSSVDSCILQNSRPVSGWDLTGTGMKFPNCKPGFYIHTFPFNSNSILNVTLIADNQAVIYANGDRYTTTIQRMFSIMLLMVTTIIQNPMQIPFGQGTNQPTYDAGYLIHFLNNARQLAIGTSSLNSNTLQMA